MVVKCPYWFQLRLLSTPAAFTVYRVSSVLSSSSRQNKTSVGGPPASASHSWRSARIAAPSSPKSLTPMSSARFGALAAAPPSRVVDMVNKQQESAEVRGEDDSRGPPSPWPDARKFLIFCYIYSIVSIWKKKMLPPSGFLTSGTHDIASVYSQ